MRRASRLAVVLGLLGLIAPASRNAEAQSARVSVTVRDISGAPVEGVTITVTCAAKSDYEVIKTTSAKGKAGITHLDSLQTYTYEFAKEGHQTLIREIRPDSAQTTQLEVVLPPAAAPRPPDGEAPGAPSGGGRALAAFNEGTEAQQRGDLGLAESKFRQAAELAPNAAEPHIALAVIAHERGDHAAAAAEAEEALSLSPDNQQALLLRYDAYRLMGDAAKTAEAAEALRSAGVTEAAAGAIFADGITDYRNGDVDAAVAKFRQAIDLDPTFVNGRIMLATVALEQGDAEQAADQASKALETEPGNSNALKIRYDATRRLGDPAAAREALDDLIAADPVWASTDLFNHAVELYNADDMANAAAALERVVELRPEDARAHFLLGMAKYNLGETEDARSHLSRFLELAPDDPDAALAREMLSYTGG